MRRRMRVGLRAGLIAAALAAVSIGPGLLAGCGGDEGSASVTVDMPTSPMSAADAGEIDAAVTAAWTDAARKDFPGLWIGVWDPSKGVVVKAYGKAERGGATARVEDNLRIGSITKTFTGAVILTLVDDGTLRLDRTVKDVDPDLAAAHKGIGSLTLRQLLGMTSGIPDYLNVSDGDIVPRLTDEPSTKFTADELIATGVGEGLRPAGMPGYSTTNYIILQQIAEKVTGRSIQDLVAERVTGPLGLKHTAFPSWADASLPEPSTHGYLNSGCAEELRKDGGTADEGRDTTSWNLTSSQGGGGAHATIADLGTWAASMSGSTLLSEGLAKARIADPKALPEGVSYGLGIYRLGKWWGHSGEVFGWEAIALHDPTTGVTVSLATNACNGATQVFLPIINALYPGTLG